jgi:CHAT domain-containing protein
LYRADRLPQAAVLYRQALNTASGANHRHCFDRLLAIYVRAGRQDQAIQTGTEYDAWLRRTGDVVRARALAHDLGHWHLALGHYADAEPHLRRALADLKGAALPPARRITALTYLALAAEKQRKSARAGQAWREVEGFARAQLDNPGGKPDLPLRIECARRLADSYRFQGRPAEAVKWLEAVLPDFGRLRKPDPAGERDTLRQLAAHLTAARRPADAEKRLKEALERHETHAADDPLTRADLSCELADVLERLGRPEEGAALRQRAIRAYGVVLKDSRSDRHQKAGALAAFWKLQVLHQRASQYDQALKLIHDHAGQWGGGLIEPRLHAEQGRLQVLLGKYAPSRELLKGVVAELEAQLPLNLMDFPPALLNLGVAELATGSQGKAKEAGLRCRALYEKFDLADDLLLVDAFNLLGTCEALDGNYAVALAHFRKGVARCDPLGRAAYPQRCGLWLNIALLHKAQGDPESALEACAQARADYERFAEPSAFGFAALDAGQAVLLASQGQLEKAKPLADQVLAACEKHKRPEVALMSAAWHCRALFHLHPKRRNLAAAEQALRKVEELHGDQSPLRPRTLNYLALTRELQGRWDEAANLYEEAKALQEKNPRAFPVTYFTTLWRLANVAQRRGRLPEARALLKRSIAVAETARLRIYGDARQRAAFFAQFEPALEQLVEWSVRDGCVAEAVVAAARGRSRTLLDQLLLAGVDLFQGLQGKQQKEWLAREQELRRSSAALRARIQLTSPEDNKGADGAPALLAKLERQQEEYTRVYRELLNASADYHSLPRQEFTAKDLEDLRRALGPKKLLLVYHVGRRQSHLLLLGDLAGPAEAYPLTVPADVAERIDRPASLARAEVLARTRRGRIVLRPPEQPKLPARNQEPTRPLGRDVLRALVENYLEQIAHPGFQPGLGLQLPSRPGAPVLRPQRADLLGEILLPEAARRRIKATRRECLIVVPDGALHQLPFEALLLPDGDSSSYVLDELPPLAYAPSVAILALLVEPRPAPPGGLKSLLTVADPAYPQGKARKAKPHRPAPGATRRDPGPAPYEILGPLPLLPGTRKESEHLERLFTPDQFRALRGAKATKGALVAALRDRHVVHIAAHGIAHMDFGNLFGGLALTPDPGLPEDDGFLPLHEIYALPLKACELAVLSACVTNVGPQRQLEAGVTLTGGFLAAGARRVVASHWGVDDEATAELMKAFFARVLGAAKEGRQVTYARALQEARQQVRAHRDRGWSAPYYWAPFVLVGPAD